MTTREQQPDLNGSYNSFLISRAQEGDRQALEAICSNTLPYIETIARRRQSTLTDDELVQAALTEVPNLVQRFDQSRGVPFSKFLAIRALGAMIDEQRLLGSQIGLSRDARSKLQQALESTDPDQQLTELEDDGFVTARAFIEDGNVVDRPASLDKYGSELVATSNVPEEAIMNVEISRARSALERLPERQSSVLKRYFGVFGEPQLYLREIGEADGVTESRISQIKQQAFENLEATLKS